MLATLTEQLPTERKWIYEPKLDGVRALIYVSGGTVRIYSRNRKLLNDGYPELVEASSQAVPDDAVLDGEIVAFDPERGITSFARLQQRMQLRYPVRARRPVPTARKASSPSGRIRATSAHDRLIGSRSSASAGRSSSSGAIPHHRGRVNGSERYSWVITTLRISPNGPPQGFCATRASLG